MLHWAARIGRRVGGGLAEEFRKRNAIPDELLVRVEVKKIVAATDVAEVRCVCAVSRFSSLSVFSASPGEEWSECAVNPVSDEKLNTIGAESSLRALGVYVTVWGVWQEATQGGWEIHATASIFAALLAQQPLTVSAIEVSELYAPTAIIAGVLLLGFVFEVIVLKKLGEAIANSRFSGKEMVIRAVRGVTTLWFGIAGVRFALTRLSLDQNMVTLLNHVLLVALIVSGAIVLTRLVAGLLRIHAGKVQGLPSSSLLVNLARIVIVAMAALIILQSVGIEIAPVLAALGVGGLAVALALQDTLSNLFSGVIIMASKQLRPGDFVGLDSGEEGYVEDVTWRNTTIRTLGNNMVIVPNSTIAQSNITNYYQPERQMSVIVPVGVSYASDLQHVEEVTTSVANEVMSEIEGGVPEFEPLIRFNNFGDFSIDFSVILRTREVAQQYKIMHEFMKLLHKRYREEDIEIPYPVTTNIHTEAGGSNGHAGNMADRGQ